MTGYRRAARGVSLALLTALILTGCAGVPAIPGGAAPSPEPSTAPAPTDPVPAVAYDPEATAEHNLIIFDAVLAAVADAGENRPSGRRLVDALVAAGFPKRQMEVTRDQSRTGDRADAITVAVDLNGQCLIGSFRSRTAYSSLVTPALSASDCLVGETRPIDW